MSDNVTLSKVLHWDASFVAVCHIKRGIIRPEGGRWIAEMMGCYKTDRPECVYGIFDTKQEAIDAIVRATAKHPPYTVFPERNLDSVLMGIRLGVPQDL